MESTEMGPDRFCDFWSSRGYGPILWPAHLRFGLRPLIQHLGFAGPVKMFRLFTGSSCTVMLRLLPDYVASLIDYLITRHFQNHILGNFK